MTNEEMQKTMQFILKQQAQFAVNMQKLEEAQTKAEARITQLEGAIVGVVNLLGNLTKAQERTDARVNELAEKVTQLTEAQKQTGERLNALINIVERYITERRNGNAQT